jgi:hypothetical protein
MPNGTNVTNPDKSPQLATAYGRAGLNFQLRQVR